MESTPERYYIWQKLKSHRVVKPDGCWVWDGCKDKDGYGKITWNKRYYRVHILVAELTFNDFKSWLCVCHTCDNPKCFNPEHLFMATNEENTKDRTAKNRDARGERQGLSKLTEAQVKEIRFKKNLRNTADLAKQHGVSEATIYDVCSRTWKGRSPPDLEIAVLPYEGT